MVFIVVFKAWWLADSWPMDCATVVFKAWWLADSWPMDCATESIRSITNAQTAPLNVTFTITTKSTMLQDKLTSRDIVDRLFLVVTSEGEEPSSGWTLPLQSIIFKKPGIIKEQCGRENAKQNKTTLTDIQMRWFQLRHTQRRCCERETFLDEGTMNTRFFCMVVVISPFQLLAYR